MKWVLLALLVINAVFFTWQLSREDKTLSHPGHMQPKTRSAMVNRLLLVSELERGVLRERRGLPTSETPVATAADPVTLGEVLAAPSQSLEVCYTIGPLEEDARLAELSAWFGAHGVQANLRVDERREVARTWVYLPPLDSRETADAWVEEMRARGVDDIFVIPRGDMANAISLGLYSQRDSLQRRLAHLEGVGYEPLVLPRYRVVTASWFDVASSESGPFVPDAFAERFPQIEVRSAPCPDERIATDPVIPYNFHDSRQQQGVSGDALGDASEVSGSPESQ